MHTETMGDEIEVVEVLRAFLVGEVQADKYEPLRRAIHDSDAATKLFAVTDDEEMEAILSAPYAQDELVAIVKAAKAAW